MALELVVSKCKEKGVPLAPKPLPKVQVVFLDLTKDTGGRLVPWRGTGEECETGKSRWQLLTPDQGKDA